ncbi:amidase protein [Trichoderma pleuroticola]
MFLLEYLQHRSFQERPASRQIRALPACHDPFSLIDREIISKPIEYLVLEILNTYGKVAVKVHEKTNCSTEVMILGLSGPLADIPVSLKDTVDEVGYDSLVGFSKFVGEHVGDVKTEDGVITKLLKDARAVPYVKVSTPITLLSFESGNDVWGRSTNPYNKKYSPGGSTVYSLKFSTGRWMKLGASTSMPGQDAIHSPWAYDYMYSIHPLPWKSEVEQEVLGPLRVGGFRTDGAVDSGPVCKKALELAEAALRNAGHEMVEINLPSPYEALQLASHLLYLLYDWHAKDAYKRGWFEWWEDANIDFIIAPPNALPAVPHNGMLDAVSSCGYTFLFNPIDYSAGVIPVTHVDKETDRLPSILDIKRLRGIARGAYELYNADDKRGLPVGVQVVVRRLEEEKVLAAMRRLKDALGDDEFKLLDPDWIYIDESV